MKKQIIIFCYALMSVAKAYAAEVPIAQNTKNAVHNPTGQVSRIPSLQQLAMAHILHNCTNLKLLDGLLDKSLLPDELRNKLLNHLSLRLLDRNSLVRFLSHEFSGPAIAFYRDNKCLPHLSPDGSLMVLCGTCESSQAAIDLGNVEKNHILCIWDLRMGSFLHRLVHDDPIKSHCFNSDGSILFTVTYKENRWEDVVYAWDVATGRLLWKLTNLHDSLFIFPFCKRLILVAPYSQHLAISIDERTGKWYGTKKFPYQFFPSCSGPDLREALQILANGKLALLTEWNLQIIDATKITSSKQEWDSSSEELMTADRIFNSLEAMKV